MLSCPSISKVYLVVLFSSSTFVKWVCLFVGWFYVVSVTGIRTEVNALLRGD